MCPGCGWTELDGTEHKSDLRKCTEYSRKINQQQLVQDYQDNKLSPERMETLMVLNGLLQTDGHQRNDKVWTLVQCIDGLQMVYDFAEYFYQLNFSVCQVNAIDEFTGKELIGKGIINGRLIDAKPKCSVQFSGITELFQYINEV